MRTASVVIFATTAFLLVIVVAGVYFQKEQTTIGWLPAELLNKTVTNNQWGNLAGFKLVVNATLNHTAIAPIIINRDAPINEEKLRTIASEVFAMKAPQSEDFTPLWDLYLKEGFKDTRSKGARMSYSIVGRGEAAEIGDWDQDRVRNISDQMIATLEPYWEMPTDAIRRVSFIGPTGWVNSDKWINLFTVRYVWSIQGIDLTGYGCSVTVRHDYGIESTLYDEPTVYVNGEQQVTVAPEDALATFIAGRSINSVLGVPKLRIINPPRNGTLVIEDLRLVYYPIKSPEGRTTEVLVYRIGFTILYEDEGRPASITSFEYEYAN